MTYRNLANGGNKECYPDMKHITKTMQFKNRLYHEKMKSSLGHGKVESVSTAKFPTREILRMLCHW